jgi:hypothetical protein
VVGVKYCESAGAQPRGHVNSDTSSIGEFPNNIFSKKLRNKLRVIYKKSLIREFQALEFGGVPVVFKVGNDKDEAVKIGNTILGVVRV